MSHVLKNDSQYKCTHLSRYGKSFYWIESIIKVELCCEMAGAKEYCEEYRIALAT